jgi:hypothetical protein
MMSSILRENLRERAASAAGRPQIAGKIRPGTKEITKSASQNVFAVEQFRRAKAGQITFKEAEKLIAEKTSIKFPFYPRNTQYFNLNQGDFPGSAHAVERMLEMYGEQRDGDTDQRLYRFPVMFPPARTVEEIFPSEFRVPQGAVRYHSAYGDDGVRRCLYLKPVEAANDGQAKRKKFLRRKEAVRGECNPATCAEFACGACRFGGTLLFYVPGIAAGAPFAMSTGSTYAAEDIFQMLDNVMRICRGVLPVADARGEPVFYMTKVKRTMTYFDENGAEKRGEQWVPMIETTLQMPTVLLLEQAQRMRISAPAAAPDVAGVPAAWLAVAVGDEAATGGSAVEAPAVHAEQGVSAVPAQEGQIPESGNPSNLQIFLDLIADLGLEQVAIDWAQAKFGESWDEDDTVGKPLADLRELLEKLPSGALRGFLELSTALYRQQLLPVKEVAMAYLRGRYGKGLFGDPKLLQSAMMHVHELVESSGREVALAHMKASVGVN